MPPDFLRERIARTRELTDRPFGVHRSPYREGEVPRYASFMLTPWFEGEIELGPMWAGESVALVEAVLPAGEIVRRIASEADETLARVSGQM